MVPDYLEYNSKYIVLCNINIDFDSYLFSDHTLNKK